MRCRGQWNCLLLLTIRFLDSVRGLIHEAEQRVVLGIVGRLAKFAVSAVQVVEEAHHTKHLVESQMMEVMSCHMRA